ncbi:hypothetical protein GOL87_28095 [Sinorhizobium medicae]|nr:hypothetical protein [Sinorhizobium medicae]
MEELIDGGRINGEPPPTDLTFSFTPEEPKALSLCLDSLGGNFEEALKLIKTIGERDLATVLPRDATCLSACAFTFLSGQISSYNTDGGQVTPYRVMHVSATLGFHSPFPDLTQFGEVLPTGMAIEFYKTGIQSVVDLNTELSARDTFESTARFPADLLLSALENVDRYSFYYIDNVDKAGRYDIRLAGVPDIKMDWDAFVRLCDNASSWTWNVKGGYAPDTSLFNLEISPDPTQTSVKAATRRSKGIVIRSRHANCTVKTRINPGDDFSVRFTTFALKPRERPMEPWHSLPHYVTHQHLSKSGVSFDVSQFETKYTSADGVVKGANRTIDQLLPNQLLVVQCDPDKCEDSYGIFFGESGRATIKWPEGQSENLIYSLQPTKACFKGEAGSTRSFCGFMSRDENDQLTWSFDNTSLPGGSIQFMRPALQLPQD